MKRRRILKILAALFLSGAILGFFARYGKMPKWFPWWHPCDDTVSTQIICKEDFISGSMIILCVDPIVNISCSSGTYNVVTNANKLCSGSSVVCCYPQALPSGWAFESWVGFDGCCEGSANNKAIVKKE